MVIDFNQKMKEYNNIIKEYIQKITQLSSNFSKKILRYISTLEFWDGQLKDLLLLFEKMELIISFQSVMNLKPKKKKIN